MKPIPIPQARELSESIQAQPRDIGIFNQRVLHPMNNFILKHTV